MFQVTGANSRRTKIEIGLPIDATGNPVFDDNDNPIKGRDPVILVLPRYNYMSFDQLKELMKLGAEIDARELTDDYTVMDRGRDAILAQLQPFVDAETLTVLAGLTLGELTEINDEWTRASNVPLGESLASAGSSKNMQRPSNTTSSPKRPAASAT